MLLPVMAMALLVLLVLEALLVVLLVHLDSKELLTCYALMAVGMLLQKDMQPML